MKYVIFPGTPGNYLSTPDVNLLADADTAHLQQSIGEWFTGATLDAPTLSTDVAAPYGSSVGKTAIADTTTEQSLRASNTATIGGREHSASILIYPADSAGLFRVRMRWYDSGGTFISGNNGLRMTAPLGKWTAIRHTAIAPASAAELRLWIDQDANVMSDGDVFYFSKACVCEGSDTTFVPSLRIVGDFEAEAKVKVPAHTGDWRSFISTAYNGDGFMLRQEQSSPVAGLLHADGTWRGGESSTQIPVDQWTTIRGRAELGVEFSFVFNNVPAGSDSINSNPGLPSGKDLTIGTWLSSSGPDQDFVGSMSHALARDGIDGPIVASFDAEVINV